MATTEIKIVEITRKGDAIEKGAKPLTYVVPVQYHLENGQILDSSRGFRLLRDAKAVSLSLPQVPPRPLLAMFGEDGTYWGTTEVFAL